MKPVPEEQNESGWDTRTHVPKLYEWFSPSPKACWLVNVWIPSSVFRSRSKSRKPPGNRWVSCEVSLNGRRSKNRIKYTSLVITIIRTITSLVCDQIYVLTRTRFRSWWTSETRVYHHMCCDRISNVSGCECLTIMKHDICHSPGLFMTKDESRAKPRGADAVSAGLVPLVLIEERLKSKSQAVLPFGWLGLWGWKNLLLTLNPKRWSLQAFQ